MQMLQESMIGDFDFCYSEKNAIRFQTFLLTKEQKKNIVGRPVPIRSALRWSCGAERGAEVRELC